MQMANSGVNDFEDNRAWVDHAELWKALTDKRTLRIADVQGAQTVILKSSENFFHFWQQMKEM